MRAHRNLRLRVSSFAEALARELESFRELRPLRRKRDRSADLQPRKIGPSLMKPVR